MSNYYNEEFSINKKAALKRALENFFSLFLFTIIAYIIANAAIPQKFELWIRIIFIIILIYGLIDSYNTYKFIRNGLNYRTFVDKIARENDIPVETLKAYSLEHECAFKIIDKKIDILKLISPIPILIYFLGMYVEKKDKLNVTFNVIGMDVTSSDALLFSGLVITFLYLLYMKKYVGLYRYNLRKYYDFKNDAYKLEARLKKKDCAKN